MQMHANHLNINLYTIHIQTTNQCNGHCTMCNFDNYYGNCELRVMEDSTWNKILDDYSEIKSPSKRISFSLNYEPFTDEKIFSRIRGCKSKGISTSIVTNGILLQDDDIYKKYISSPVEDLRISFPGVTKELYDERISSDYRNTVELFKRIYKDLGHKKRIGVAICIENGNEFRYLSEFVKELGVAFSPTDMDFFNSFFKVNLIDSRGGAVTGVHDSSSVPKKKRRDNDMFGMLSQVHSNEYKNLCPLVWNDMCIDVKGDVPICCWGIEEEPGRIIGNVKDKTIREIFFQDMEQVRKPFRMRKSYDEKCLRCFSEFQREDSA